VGLGWPEVDIVKVLGFYDVNSHAVRAGGGAYRGRGVYPLTSLMNHSCITNTRNLIFGDTLEVRATVAIPAGATLTTHYVSPLLHRGARQQKLKERWFFDCTCTRCSDPTDGGAYTSALRCPSCPSFLLPPEGAGAGAYTCR